MWNSGEILNKSQKILYLGGCQLGSNFAYKNYKIKQFDKLVLSIHQTWENFIEESGKPDGPLCSNILTSWERSKEYGVNPFQESVPNILAQNILKEKKELNKKLLSFAIPTMKQFYPVVKGAQTIITLSDNLGVVLDAVGDREIRNQAMKINFFPGADWCEEIAGTNAIGTVIKQKSPVQILFTEHFCTGWHNWTCVASPIINPITNELIGVLCISGMWSKFPHHIFGMAHSIARTISLEIEKNYLNVMLNVNPLLSAALSSVVDGVIIIDNNKQVVKINKKARELLDVDDLYDLNKGPQMNKLVTIILNKEENFVKTTFTYNKMQFLCSINPVFDENNNVSGAIVCIRDYVIVPKKAIKKNEDNKVRYNFNSMFGSSATFLDSIKKAKKAAKFDTTILITGETGVGKELFVQAIHSESSRQNNAFIAINCGAIPKELIESELFGYEPGAFTGAKQKGSIGKFELANEGTIFLDEIGEMPLTAQVHLLRVLEERSVTRIGGNKSIPINVRVIAATNRNLLEMTEEGTFRADLLYRLKVIHFKVPPLRDRREDISTLAYKFIEQIGHKFGISNIEIDDIALKHLINYSWPGNIRELKNTIEQSLFNSDGKILHSTDLPEDILNNTNKLNPEKEAIAKALMDNDYKITKAANCLGVSRATLYRKMDKLNLSVRKIKQMNHKKDALFE